MNWLIAAIVVAIPGWAIFVYNRLVQDRNRIAQSWSDVDVQLRRRHDLVPRLVELVKGYASYEQALLTQVSELRSQGQRLSHPGELAGVESSLGAAMQRVVAIAEAYPDLKASENFLQLQRELVETEDSIQYARRYYNGAVNRFNTRIQSFPDMFIARLMALRAVEFFELDQQAAAMVPAVKLP
ncbi:MAG: LemA family protein [Steroidobacteraceae bacterium]